MKAIVFRKYGGPEILELAELPAPEPGPGKILVRVRVTSVNPVDWKIAGGQFWPILRARFPSVPGLDVAGEVVRCGEGLSDFAPGTRVHACMNHGAASAEYTLTTPDLTVPMPAGMDYATAAGLPLAGMTALQGLRDKGGMPMEGATQRVLVIGASGGVGHLAVQIARAAGATVIGVCSDRNRALVERLGAREVIDYRAPDPYRNLAACDIILDCVGQSPSKLLRHLKPGGRYVSALPGLALLLRGLIPLGSKKVKTVILKPNAADLRILDDLVSAGKLRVETQRFPLEQMRAAWERSISGRTIGKIVIDVAAR
jgi:NADPH:quinone reductase-like Zn-dependent oxidoreductase